MRLAILRALLMAACMLWLKSSAQGGSSLERLRSLARCVSVSATSILASTPDAFMVPDTPSATTM